MLFELNKSDHMTHYKKLEQKEDKFIDKISMKSCQTFQFKKILKTPNKKFNMCHK